eukprot:gene457-578_t
MGNKSSKGGHSPVSSRSPDPISYKNYEYGMDLRNDRPSFLPTYKTGILYDKPSYSFTEGKFYPPIFSRSEFPSIQLSPISSHISEPSPPTSTNNTLKDHWVYEQSTGKIFNKDGEMVKQGYSGKGEDKNKTESESKISQGPIVRGEYTIEAPRDSSKTRVYVLDLTPNEKNDMKNRSGFQIHGASKDHPLESSEGCIVLDRDTRELIAESGVNQLLVVEKVEKDSEN